MSHKPAAERRDKLMERERERERGREREREREKESDRYTTKRNKYSKRGIANAMRTCQPHGCLSGCFAIHIYVDQLAERTCCLIGNTSPMHGSNRNAFLCSPTASADMCGCQSWFGSVWYGYHCSHFGLWRFRKASLLISDWRCSHTHHNMLCCVKLKHKMV